MQYVSLNGESRGTERVAKKKGREGRSVWDGGRARLLLLYLTEEKCFRQDAAMCLLYQRHCPWRCSRRKNTKPYQSIGHLPRRFTAKLQGFKQQAGAAGRFIIYECKVTFKQKQAKIFTRQHKWKHNNHNCLFVLDDPGVCDPAVI